MVEPINSSQISYIVATASFDDSFDNRYADLYFYEKQSFRNIDLEAATFGERQYIHL